MLVHRPKIIAVVALAVVVTIFSVQGCKKKVTQPTEPEAGVVLNENTKLPEENADLDTVLVVGDTLLFVYKPGSSMPEFSDGDIVVGRIGEGYLRRVVSSTAKGDTVVLDTDQASVTDAVEKGKLDTTFALSASQQQLSPIRERRIFKGEDGRDYRLDIRSDGPSIYPTLAGDVFEIRVPNVNIEVRDSNNNLAISVTIDTLVLKKSIDMEFRLHIGNAQTSEFMLVESSTDEVFFVGVSMDLEKSIVSGDAQIKLLTLPLGKIVVMMGPFPIPLVFEVGVYAGVRADLTVNASTNLANEVSLSATNTIGAQYGNGSWQPICEQTLDGSAGFSFNPSASISASLVDYLKGSLDMKVYGALGPSLYLEPYQYNEVSYPPLDYELGVGLAAGLAFKVEIFSWMLAEFNHTFGDYRKLLLHSTEGPDPPTLYSPADGATIADNTPTFDWSEPAGAAGYHIQVDDNSNFSSPVMDQYPSASTYTPSSALADGGYYWRVQAKSASDVWGDWSDVWSFTIDTGGGNEPPNTPSTPGGPSTGDVGISYEFTSSATDPDGDDIAIRFAWGDGDTSAWSSYVSSGSSVSMSHSWASSGTYYVKAQAKDIHEATSGWSAEHAIEISGGGDFPNRVVATIPVGDTPVGLASLPNGNYVYVANKYSDNVSVIRTSDNTVVATIPVGLAPCGVASLPNGNYVYVTNYYDHNVSVIRTSDNTVVATIPVGIYPAGVASLPNGNYVYVANWYDDNVSVIRTSDNTVMATIPVGYVPEGVASLPNGNYVYVADDNVSVIRTSDNTVVATIPVGDSPYGIASLPNGNYVYVTNHSSDNVSVIRTSDNTVMTTIPVGDTPEGVASLPNGSYVYVANWYDVNVSVIRTSDNIVVATIPVGVGPSGVAALPNGNYVYVANAGSGNVSVIGF